MRDEVRCSVVAMYFAPSWCRCSVTYGGDGDGRHIVEIVILRVQVVRHKCGMHAINHIER